MNCYCVCDSCKERNAELVELRAKVAAYEAASPPAKPAPVTVPIVEDASKE